MMLHRKSAKEIAPGLWTEILVAAGIDRSLLTKEESPCPLCGGNTRFTYYDKETRCKDGSDNPNGLSSCRHCGGRNGLTLLKDYLGLDTAKAYKWIEDWYYDIDVQVRPMPVVKSSKGAAKTPEEIAQIKEKHRKCFQEASPVVKGDPVWKYLCNRIPNFHEGMIAPCIRYHSSLPYYEYDKVAKKTRLLGKFPAMVAYVTAPNGECQDIHRTYLTMDGKKANVPCPKKTLASYDVFGGAIQLSRPRGNVLAVTEGIETAYAVELFKNLPTWPLLNTSNMEVFVIPSWVKVLHIFEDNDEADTRGIKVGTKAAMALQARAEQAGIRVYRHAASKTGMDFLDLLVKIHGQPKAA